MLAAVSLLIPLATSYAFASGAMRFPVDFVSFLAVPALLLWFLASGLEDERLRRAFRVGGLLAIVWSCVVNLCLSLTGASDGLRRDNPALFRSIEARFEPSGSRSAVCSSATGARWCGCAPPSRSGWRPRPSPC